MRNRTIPLQLLLFPGRADEFNAVRALETITFCVVVFATVLLGVYVFAEGARRQSVAIVLMVLCFLAGKAPLCKEPALSGLAEREREGERGEEERERGTEEERGGGEED